MPEHANTHTLSSAGFALFCTDARNSDVHHSRTPLQKDASNIPKEEHIMIKWPKITAAQGCRRKDCTLRRNYWHLIALCVLPRLTHVYPLVILKE